MDHKSTSGQNTREEWEAKGYLKKSKEAKVFEVFGAVVAINFSRSGVWQTLEASGMVRTHLFSFSKIQKIGFRGKILTGYTLHIGPLSLVIAI